MESKVTLVDAAGVTAQHVQNQLSQLDSLQESGHTGKTRFYVSSEPESFAQTAQKFLGRPVEAQLKILGK